MGATSPLIAEVETPSYGRIVVAASDGKRYHADLSSFARVFCYPKSFDEWQKVGIDSFGLALVWTSRFEVHVDQILALADRVESARVLRDAQLALHQRGPCPRLVSGERPPS